MMAKLNFRKVEIPTGVSRLLNIFIAHSAPFLTHVFFSLKILDTINLTFHVFYSINNFIMWQHAEYTADSKNPEKQNR